MSWVKSRLGEHSTQLALGGMFSAVAAGFNGSMGWATVATTCIGLLIPLLVPATK